MNENELVDFIEGFVVIHSMNRWECKLVSHPRNGLYRVELPKLLILEIYTYPNKTAFLKFLFHGGRGAFAKFDFFEKGLLKHNYSWKQQGSHVYFIENIIFDEVVDVMQNHVSELIS